MQITECGCCGEYHRADFAGDCRDDSERFPSVEAAAERLGVDALDVERYEYEEGEVVEHFVETWPDYRLARDLPLE